jgi:hypothetical protein
MPTLRPNNPRELLRLIVFSVPDFNWPGLMGLHLALENQRWAKHLGVRSPLFAGRIGNADFLWQHQKSPRV